MRTLHDDDDVVDDDDDVCAQLRILERSVQKCRRNIEAVGCTFFGLVP